MIEILIVFASTFFISLGAWTFAVTASLTLQNNERNFQLPLFIGALLIGLGVSLLVLHA